MWLASDVQAMDIVTIWNLPDYGCRNLLSEEQDLSSANQEIALGKESAALARLLVPTLVHSPNP